MTDDTPPDPRTDEAPAPDVRPGDSILETLARRTGRAPRVNLRDAGTGDAAPANPPAVGVRNATEARRAIDALVLVDATQAIIAPKMTSALLGSVPDPDSLNAR